MKPIPIYALLASSLSLTAVSLAAAADSAGNAVVKRGEYLTAIGGCGDCHTPLKMGPKGPEPDTSRMLSGHPETLKMPGAPDLGRQPKTRPSGAGRPGTRRAASYPRPKASAERT